MDKLTVKIMSHSCKMADITDEGVSCKNHKKVNDQFVVVFNRFLVKLAVLLVQLFHQNKCFLNYQYGFK